MILSFLSAKSRQTSKSKLSNKYLKPSPRNNTLKSVALAVALSVELKKRKGLGQTNETLLRTITTGVHEIPMVLQKCTCIFVRVSRITILQSCKILLLMSLSTAVIVSVDRQISNIIGQTLF